MAWNDLINFPVHKARYKEDSPNSALSVPREECFQTPPEKTPDNRRTDISFAESPDPTIGALVH